VIIRKNEIADKFMGNKLMNEISDSKLKTFIFVGAVGITVILLTRFILSILHKSVVAGINMIGFY
jgi:hypothetical protein